MFDVYENGAYFGLTIECWEGHYQARWAGTGASDSPRTTLQGIRQWLASKGYTCHDLPSQ